MFPSSSLGIHYGQLVPLGRGNCDLGSAHGPSEAAYSVGLGDGVRVRDPGECPQLGYQCVLLLCSFHHLAALCGDLLCLPPDLLLAALMRGCRCDGLCRGMSSRLRCLRAYVSSGRAPPLCTYFSEYITVQAHNFYIALMLNSNQLLGA